MDFCWQSNVSAFNMLSTLVITFLPRSTCLLISWLQSPSEVILEPPQNKVCYCFHHFPIYVPWSDGVSTGTAWLLHQPVYCSSRKWQVNQAQEAQDYSSVLTPNFPPDDEASADPFLQRPDSEKPNIRIDSSDPSASALHPSPPLPSPNQDSLTFAFPLTSSNPGNLNSELASPWSSSLPSVCCSWTPA